MKLNKSAPYTLVLLVVIFGALSVGGLQGNEDQDGTVIGIDLGTTYSW
jgi:hypothetical protein